MDGEKKAFIYMAERELERKKCKRKVCWINQKLFAYEKFIID